MANKWMRLGKAHAKRLFDHIIEKSAYFEQVQSNSENALGLATCAMFIACKRQADEFREFQEWLDDAYNSAEA